MKVTEDHWLDGAKRVSYPQTGAPMNIRRFAVAHFTSGATAMSSIEFWKSGEANGAEAHAIIDRDGTIYQIRPFNMECDHAGKSVWTDPNTGHEYTYLNRCAIGIEFANAGDDDALAKHWTHLPLVSARHKNGGPVENWEAYPEAQVLAGIEVFKAIVTRYHLDDVVGHDDIAPTRKNDPGPAFPMLRLREACGFKGLPKRA